MNPPLEQPPTIRAGEGAHLPSNGNEPGFYGSRRSTRDSWYRACTLFSHGCPLFGGACPLSPALLRAIVLLLETYSVGPYKRTFLSVISHGGKR
jgi:hypothetical protein